MVSLLLLLLLSFTKQFAVDAKRTFEVSDDVDDVPNIFLSSLCADERSKHTAAAAWSVSSVHEERR